MSREPGDVHGIIPCRMQKQRQQWQQQQQQQRRRGDDSSSSACVCVHVLKPHLHRLPLACCRCGLRLRGRHHRLRWRWRSLWRVIIHILTNTRTCLLGHYHHPSPPELAQVTLSVIEDESESGDEKALVAATSSTSIVETPPPPQQQLMPPNTMLLLQNLDHELQQEYKEAMCYFDNYQGIMLQGLSSWNFPMFELAYKTDAVLSQVRFVFADAAALILSFPLSSTCVWCRC